MIEHIGTTSFQIYVKVKDVILGSNPDQIGATTSPESGRIEVVEGTRNRVWRSEEGTGRDILASIVRVII